MKYRETELAITVLEFDKIKDLQAYIRSHGGKLSRGMAGVAGGWFDPRTNTICVKRAFGVHSLYANMYGHELIHAIEHANGETHSHGQ